MKPGPWFGWRVGRAGLSELGMPANREILFARAPKLAACLCFRDSAPYLHEWLLFHAVQGFSRFYLYDNDSSDDYGTVLDPWIRASIVRCRRWAGLGQQQAIYDHCLANVDRDVDWIAFLDDDEFLFATDHEPLSSVLSNYEEFAGVAVCWQLFGTSGHQEFDPAWVIRRFTRCADQPDAHVKCIVQPSRVVRSSLIGHVFEPKPGFHLVDEHQRAIATPLSPRPSCDRLRINHYITRSQAELRARRLLRPQANTGRIKEHTAEQWQDWDRGWNTTFDASATAFTSEMHELDRRLHRDPKAADGNWVRWLIHAIARLQG